MAQAALFTNRKAAFWQLWASERFTVPFLLRGDLKPGLPALEPRTGAEGRGQLGFSLCLENLENNGFPVWWVGVGDWGQQAAFRGGGQGSMGPWRPLLFITSYFSLESFDFEGPKLFAVF